VKVGSSTLQAVSLDSLMDVVAMIRERGIDIAIVTSGAVSCGMQRIQLTERPRELTQIQAVAAIGQADLMARYQVSLARHSIVCAQILLTHGDLAARRNFLNIRHTLHELFGFGVVPIANENDTVATDELRFGDNDRLAAAFATVVEADLVILLSDIPALFDADPRRVPTAKPIHDVLIIGDSIRAMAGKAGSSVGTGGMTSKIQAAEIATQAGIPLIIANGADPSVLLRILAGEVIGTLFHPQRQITRRRHWIGFLSRVLGVIRVDTGAAEAMRSRPSSLLPIGVTAVEGRFDSGDAVELRDPEDKIIGRGLVNYSSEKLHEIIGLKRSVVLEKLERADMDPVVHRNDFVVATDLAAEGTLGA